MTKISFLVQFEIISFHKYINYYQICNPLIIENLQRERILHMQRFDKSDSFIKLTGKENIVLVKKRKLRRSLKNQQPSQ